MNTPATTFSPTARRLEKQATRDEDDRLLREGLTSAEELQRRNDFFAALGSSRSVITRRRIRFGDAGQPSQPLKKSVSFSDHVVIAQDGNCPEFASYLI